MSRNIAVQVSSRMWRNDAYDEHVILGLDEMLVSHICSGCVDFRPDVSRYDDEEGHVVYLCDECAMEEDN